MGILFILSSFCYSVIVFVSVVAVSYHYLNVNLIPDFLNGAFNSFVGFLFSERSVFIIFGLLLLYFVLVFVMFFKQKENKKLRVLCLIFPLLSMLFAVLLIAWTLTLHSRPFIEDTAKYNLYFATCILNIVLLVVQLGVSIANGVEFTENEE